MSTRLIFPSIQHPDRRYTWWEASYDAPFHSYGNHSYILDEHAGQFETYGDGDIQHNAEQYVNRDDWIDYLTSLGQYLCEHPMDAEHVQANWPRDDNAKRVAFALDLKYVEGGKRRYYSLEELKVSSAPSKAYDKRWFEVDSALDGSLASAFRVLRKEWHGLMEQFALLKAIMDAANVEHNRYWWEDAFKLLGYCRDEKPTEDRYAVSHMHAAYLIVDYAVQSWRMHDVAKRTLSCQQNNWCHNVLGIGRELETV